jgi:alkyl sulfatase BDS1-like metallo-beta-lactamase superfamily hydrolase
VLARQAFDFRRAAAPGFFAMVGPARRPSFQRRSPMARNTRKTIEEAGLPASAKARYRLLGSVRVSFVLTCLVALAGVAFLVIKFVPSLRKAAVIEIAEIAGSVAEGYMVTSRPVEVVKVGEVVYQATGIANTHLIPTSEGHVIFDTGLAIQAAKQKRVLEEAAGSGPVSHVILSHSHQDHVGGVALWVDDETEVIAHTEFLEEQRYLKELEPYLWKRNRRLFPWLPEAPPASGLLEFGRVAPNVFVAGDESLAFEQGGIHFEVIPTPGAEGADNVCLWLPDQKILLSGDFFGPIFPQFPNIFTMRGEKTRKPVEYIRSLDRLIALEPEIVIPSHLEPVYGREQIKAAMIRMRDAVRYVHDQTVAGMNAGKTVYELMEEIQLPPELELSQIHGRVSWGVKSIWEYYATWFHHDSTTELYPVPIRSLYAELAELAGPDSLTVRGRRHLEAGEPVASLHFAEIVLEGDAGSRPALELRRDALAQLLVRAKETHENAFELGWLDFQLKETRARRAEGSS